MNKIKMIGCSLLLTSALLFTGCSASINIGPNNDSEKTEDAKTDVPSPNLNEIKEICKLTTLKCVYHNIAKSTKMPGKGLTHIGEKERKFWIEYTGTVKVSYDLSKIDMDQDGTNITITLPNPETDCEVDKESWNADSYITTKDQLLQKNPITAEDQTLAVDQAQQDMEDQVRNNSSLIETAERQVEELIENYINQIGDATGIDYTITWKSVPSLGNSSASTVSTAVSTEE